MKCQACGEAEAVVHYKEMKDDEVSEMHLCKKCAESKGFAGSDPEGKFSVQNLLGGMAEEEPTDGEGRSGMAGCPRCGLTYSDFKSTGRLGCSDCYTAFRAPLVPLLRRIHGSDRHEGKTPHRKGETPRRIREIRILKDRLDRCVRVEEFEEAARLRDEIRNLERENG